MKTELQPNKRAPHQGAQFVVDLGFDFFAECLPWWMSILICLLWQTLVWAGTFFEEG